MNKPLPRHYETLCLRSSATTDEIRRAYRVLARRYHPDVNPGKTSEEKFKAIAEAYAVLSTPESRAQYDHDLGEQLRSSTAQKMREYQRRQDQGAGMRARQRFYEELQRQAQGTRPEAKVRATEPLRAKPSPQSAPFADLGKFAAAWGEKIFSPLRSAVKKSPSPEGVSAQRISILEVSVSMLDAIRGVRRSVEIAQPEGMRKVSVTIPPGSKTGSVLRFRDKSGSGEELVFILRVSAHPFLSVENKGLVVEVPVSVGEAIKGASLTLPTLEDSVVVRLPPGSQSGSEIRVKGRGITGRDGTPGDLFYRVMIRVPDAPEAVGLREKAMELEGYYPGSVRQHLAKSLLEMA